jgi:pyridinium-3,5-biscarboxylic acid mononucleotide sulfurtransferase
VVKTDEFDNPDYLKNDGSRCYHCKSELYSTVEQLLPELGVPVMASGANLDDRGDYRPGLAAAAEHAVRHPLQEAGFTKADVRALAKHWGLPTWDKPASPCLSSRLAPGLEVTPERTARVEAAESALRALGLRECRVRYHEGDLARVEVPAGEIALLASEPVRNNLACEFHRLGFKFVTLDLDGFRSGSLNELVPLEMKAKYEAGT